jgi:hypothetical protein
MIWIWFSIAVLVAVLGLRGRSRIPDAAPRTGVPRVDDEALRRILEEGTLGSAAVDDEPLDPDEARMEEERFFDEQWDEPEEYRP